MDISKKRIIFIDLDSTLIETRSGETFAKGIWDMVVKEKVMMKLAELQPNGIFIVSNQGGIEKGIVTARYFEQKFLYVISALQEIVGLNVFVAGQFCPSNDDKNEDRKPNPGMLDKMFVEFSKLTMHDFTKEDCLMIGDASGKEGQWSDSDKKTAENFGCDYLDVDDFMELPIMPSQWRIVDRKSGQDTEHGLMSKSAATALAETLNNTEKDRYSAVPEKYIVKAPPKLPNGGKIPLKGVTVKKDPKKKSTKVVNTTPARKPNFKVVSKK